MYGRIIVGFDGSEGGDDAVALGRLLADRTGAELTLAGVIPNQAARRFLDPQRYVQVSLYPDRLGTR